MANGSVSLVDGHINEINTEVENVFVNKIDSEKRGEDNVDE